MPQLLPAIGLIVGPLVTSAFAWGPEASIALGGGTLGGLVGGAITSGVTFAAGLVGISAAGTLSLGAAISSWGTVALLASTALSKPKVGIGASGSQVNFQADPNAGIPLMLGRSGTAGKVIHADTSGKPDKNKALMYLIALSAGPIQAVESLTASEFLTAYVDEKAVQPDQYKDYMYLRTTAGLKPEPVAVYPAGVDPATQLPEWDNTCKTSGVACAWWTLIYHIAAYSSGMPTPMFVVRGPAVYDPRKDSSQPGGSGSQRWNDETTWAFAGNDNPFLQGISWCIGRRDNGLLSFGIGADISAIDVPAFIEGANVCDANGWKLGGEVLSSDDKWAVLTTMLQAGGGEPTRLAGKLSCYVRAPRVTITTVTGHDCIGDASITGTKARRDRINAIVPTYRSEALKWTMVPAGMVVVDEYVQADNGLRSREATYSLVQDAAQVAQLAAYDLVDAREFEPVVLPLGPAFHALKPGDCLVVNEPEYGMPSQQVIIQTRELDPTTGRIVFTCRSETPGKHEYALGHTANPPPIPGLTPSDPGYISQPDVGSWTAFGGVLQGADGAQMPAIIVEGETNDPNVADVLVDYAYELPDLSFGDTATATAPGSATRIELRALISGGTYHVTVRYRSVRGVESVFTDLGLVTAGSLVSAGVTQIGGQTPQELIDQLNETTALGLETADQAEQTAQNLLVTDQNLYDATHLPDGTPLETYAVNGISKAQADATYSVTRVDAIGVLQPDGHSFQMSAATLYAQAGQTWGDYLTLTQSSINNNSAAITTEATTRANADTALATNITNVNTKVDGNTASITTLQTSVNGLNAQWVLSVSSQGPGYARVAGIKVAANPTVSSIAFIANQIGFSDGSSNVFPLAVTGGKVIATNFQADDIKAGTITADKIVANNISVTTVGSMAAVTPLGGTPQLVSTTINCSGGYIDIQMFGNAQVGAGGYGDIVFELHIDGTYITTFGGCPYTTNGGQFNTIVGAYRHKPAAGNHTYSCYGYYTAYSGSQTASATRCVLYLTDNKTQA